MKRRNYIILIIVVIIVVGLLLYVRGRKPYRERLFPVRRSWNNGRESKGEQKCREVLTKLFGRPFVKARPDFLKNPMTGMNLELDCYCAELGLAIEYDGQQHYKYNKYFHRNEEGYLKQRYRDEFKKYACKKNGVRLVKVPYYVQPEDIEIFLREKITL